MSSSDRHSHNPGLWSSQRTYRPFIISSLCVALTLGFTTGAAIIFFRLLDIDLGTAWPTHTQSHGMAQILGWAGLFVMGLGFHIVPRIRNSSIKFPWPQRCVLTFMIVAIISRFLGQTVTSFSINNPLLAVSAISLALGLGIFSLFVGATLLKGRARHRLPELWIAASTGWAIVVAGLDLMIAYRMIDSNSVIVPSAIGKLFIEAALIGFISNFIFGISLQVVPSFLNLPPARLRLNGVSLVCINTGIGIIILTLAKDFSNWWLFAGVVFKTVGFLIYILSLRLYSRKMSPGKYIVNVYRRFEWYLQSAYFWLLIGGMLQVWKLIGDLHSPIGPPTSLGAPTIHVVGLGFITIMIIGMSTRMLPMFEAALLPLHGLLDVILILINLSVASRLIAGIIRFDLAWTVLALSGSFGTLSITLFGLVVWKLLRRSSRQEYIELTRYKVKLKTFE